MTYQLTSDSPRRAHAERFGRALLRARTARGVGQRRLLEFLPGFSRSSIRQYESGYNLPTLASAVKLAAALDCEELAEIVLEARTEACAICRKPYVNEGGTPKRYCSERCRKIAGKKNVGGPGTRQRAWLAETASLELQAVIAEHRSAVDAMCRGCEPEGLCRTADCALRPVSPLPLLGHQAVRMATKAPGSWSPQHREVTLAAIRAGNERRWGRPGERAAQSERTAARHAAARGVR